jgi:cytochrome c-type biogenesis protein CcsB
LFLAWTLLTIYLYIETQTKSKLIGSILIPVILLINGFANLTLSPEMQKSSPLVPALQSNWLMMHVSMMLLSYATLIMGSLLCILFLVISQYKDVDLKINDNSSLPLYNIMLDYYERKLLSPSNEISELGKLKLLQSIDNWSYRIIGLGFPFLTIGIIAGGVWANEAWGSYWSWDPKETWALITWLVFATYLHARITKGWEGKKTAILGGLGFFVIWIFNYAKSLRKFSVCDISVISRGKHNLAYPISNRIKGNYIQLNFSSMPKYINNFSKILKIDSNVLRFLVFNKQL